MKLSDWVMVVAILLAPLIAVQVSIFIEKQREKRKRKINVFTALMATRAAGLSPKHVEALNLIDIEFYKDKLVTDSWKAYIDHLNDKSLTREIWLNKTTDMFTDLLFNMGVTLGYNFDKTHIKRSSYSPQAHGDYENDHMIIRKALVEVLSGKKSIPMEVTQFPVSENAIIEQNDIRKLLIECLKGERNLSIIVSNKSDTKKEA